MARFWKRFKKYEKWILLGLTILLLASFNVIGISNCAHRGKGQDDYSGSYEVSPGQREEVSGEEYSAVYHRYLPFLRNWGPSLRFAHEVGRADDLGPEQATWAHIATVGAAKAAGYRVGPDELSDEIKTFVAAFGGGGRRRTATPLGFSEELYNRVIEDIYRGSKPEFEETFREVLLKDKFLAPMIDAERFSRTREDGYKAWKSSRERVNLRYVAVPAGQFAAAVEPEETTRSAVAAQEDVLQKVASSAHRVRGLLAYVVDTWAKAHEGRFPKDADELAKDGGTMPWNEDGWGKKLEYRVVDGKPLVFSAGPDGKPDTPDDVGPDAVKRLQTLATLRLTANALVEWHKATKAWPESLEAMTKPPPPAPDGAQTLAPLSAVSKDEWDHALVYEATGPVLLSTGPDGQRGGGDDLTANATPDGAVVPLPAAFDVYVAKDAKDAWGKGLSIQFRTASPWTFEVSSPGPDGVPGNDDDVKQGNAQDLAIYYNGPGVHSEYALPPRHEFEAIWVYLPLVPDETFKALWKDHPEYRPKETAQEDECYDRWRSLQGGEGRPYYRTEETDAAGKKVEIDPADPEKGCGADLLKEVLTKEQKDAGTKVKGWLVPAPDTLGDQKDPPKVETLPGKVPQPEDPLRKTYVEKGWRRVLLREMFFEHFLNALLKEAREAQEKHAAWVADPRGKDPEPNPVTFEQLIARFKDAAPGANDAAEGARFLQYYRTEKDKPLKATEWEQLIGVGDPQVSQWLKDMVKDGEYKDIPIVTKDGHGRVLLRNLKYHPDRVPDIEEVRKDVWPKYLVSRQMDRAAKELEKVRAAVKADSDRIDAIAKDLLGKAGWKFSAGETGTFVGSGFPPDLPVPATATPEEAAAIRQRSYARSNGYREVGSAGPSQDAMAVKPGQVGRSVDRDRSTGKDATDAAYLVQVISREDPAEEEFSGRHYVEWLTTAAYGKATSRQGPAAGREGYMYDEVAKYFGDYDTIRNRFDLQTARHPSDQKYNRPKKR